MSDTDAELLYRRAVSICDQVFRTKSAIEHLQRELSGYATVLRQLAQDFEVVASRAWNAYGDADTSVFAKEALAAIVCDERVRFDDC